MSDNYIAEKVNSKVDSIMDNNNVFDVGTVVKVNDFIIEVSGLENVMFYEKINVSNKAFGYVNSIKEDVVVVALLKIYTPVCVGDKVHSTNTLYTGSFSPSSIGRVIDLFGEDKLTSRVFEDLIDIPIERPTIPIMDRTMVNRPLLTGITGIDLMYPIGKGQRQLILGDKRTGKTQIGLDTIVNQQGKNVLCFYVAIGKTKKEVKNIYQELMKRGAISYTTIITAFNDELSPVISLIPYFALSVAENYLMQGYDILVVIDDLKRHAEAYREISLVSGKTPGRDAYPADIFYTHSRLLEKGCQHKNGGSITILPIVETKGGDITDYISTNIISITDGQIVLSSKNFQRGEKPAIDYGLSVSRLGGQVQDAAIKAVGNNVRRRLLSYLETRSVYELVNMDEMSMELKNQFMEGKIILSNLNQYKFSPKSPEQMVQLFQDFVEQVEEKANTRPTSSPIQTVAPVAVPPTSAPVVATPPTSAPVVVSMPTEPVVASPTTEPSVDTNVLSSSASTVIQSEEVDNPLSIVNSSPDASNTVSTVSEEPQILSHETVNIPTVEPEIISTENASTTEEPQILSHETINIPVVAADSSTINETGSPQIISHETIQMPVVDSSVQ